MRLPNSPETLAGGSLHAVVRASGQRLTKNRKKSENISCNSQPLGYSDTNDTDEPNRVTRKNKMKTAKNTTRTVWLLNGDKNDSNTKVVDVVEGFKSEKEAQAFGRKAVAERNDVVDFKTGSAY